MSASKYRLGVYAYVGAPQFGKTTLAIAEQAAIARKNRLVSITVDTVGAKNFADKPHASNVRAVCELAWGQRRDVVYTPKDQDDLDALLRAARSAGSCCLLIDEIGQWKWSKPLSMFARTWSHANSALLVTTQHVTGDLGQRFLSCSPRVRAFRITAPIAVEFFLKWKGIDPAKLRTQGVGEFVEMDL
jgi:hypothetical protein